MRFEHLQKLAGTAFGVIREQLNDASPECARLKVAVILYSPHPTEPGIPDDGAFVCRGDLNITEMLGSLARLDEEFRAASRVLRGYPPAPAHGNAAGGSAAVGGGASGGASSSPPVGLEGGGGKGGA
jgi:hypothetical protein